MGVVSMSCWLYFLYAPVEIDIFAQPGLAVHILFGLSMAAFALICASKAV